MIPKKFWELILKFLEGKKNGSVVLHVNDGNVLKIDIQESVRL